uniref:Integrase, catalytic region, zinc finger, CCHC-type, peptidase aspartic, catalytic n=1 Tax=Tanacetum cinerariifolium TaxID=118510 RepID=A0A6L2LUL8_TANCI|nr:hypothetical protein [Tanacetum cinerariifolium]
MTSLAEHIIVIVAETHPAMLKKSMYDSWASRIRLFIKGKKHGRMMLDSINNGPLVYLTVEDNGKTRPKKYFALTEAAKDIWDRVKMLMKGTELSYQEREWNKGIATTSKGNVVASPPRVVKCYNCQGEWHMSRQYTQPKRPRTAAWFQEKLMLAGKRVRYWIRETCIFNIPCVIAKEHAVIDDEETLILEEESRSKMLDKQNDSILIEKKIKISPIEYLIFNKIKEDFGKDSVENVKKDIDEIETINIELEHSVVKLLSENENLRKEREHLESIYKDQFDSIRKTWVQSKEHWDSLISQINAKSLENLDLNAQLQEKVFAITTLKNELRKLKGKNVVNTVVSKPNTIITLGMFKLDIEPISPRLKNNMDAHEVYIDKTIEYTNTLHGFVKRARTQDPSEPLLEFACMFTKHVQELLVCASQTCPNSPKPSEKLVAVTPINKDKRVRFAKLVISSNNISKQADSLITKDSNKPLLTSTGVKPTTSTMGSRS